MLLTLLVLWVVVIPVLTMAGAYMRSGILERRMRRFGKHSGVLTTESVRVAAPGERRAPVRSRADASRTRDHVVIPR